MAPLPAMIVKQELIPTLVPAHALFVLRERILQVLHRRVQRARRALTLVRRQDHVLLAMPGLILQAVPRAAPTVPQERILVQSDLHHAQIVLLGHFPLLVHHLVPIVLQALTRLRAPLCVRIVQPARSRPKVHRAARLVRPGHTPTRVLLLVRHVHQALIQQPVPRLAPIV